MRLPFEKVFKRTAKYYTHIIATSLSENLTRFGDNEISQNVSRQDSLMEVRIVDGNKAVKFVISKFDDESLDEAVKRAEEKLKYSKPLEFVPFPTKTEVKINSSRYYDKRVAEKKPSDRADNIKKMMKFCKKTNRLSYGIISDNTVEVVVADSNGLFQKSISTSVAYEITVNKNGGYGKAEAYSWKDDIDYEKINETAIRKSDLATNPVDIKPGKYTVILEPMACVEIFGFMGYLGFNALAYYENRSFMSGNLGKKIFSDKITITEDPSDFPIAVTPFDLEGFPRQRTILVENGVARGLVTDKKTSHLTGLKYTGHSLFEPNGWGAVPVSVVVEPGNKKIDEIIKETDYGIIVSELHYVNPLKPKTLELTGMTRNGTFLVKNGKIVSAVKNMRFTQSMVDAMNNVEEVSAERYTYEFWYGGVYTPALKISNFNFTSSTEF